MKEIIKVKIHSIVDVITNSSTVIYTKQNSVDEAKELVQAILDMMEIKDKTPDDIFNYGISVDNDRYAEYLNDMDLDLDEISENEKEFIEHYQNIKDWKEQDKLLNQFLDDVMNNRIEKSKWMSEIEGMDEGNQYLYLIVKDEKWKTIAEKIKLLLRTVKSEESFE